jgi:hypothetical protein
MLNKVDKRRCEICDIPCFERNNYFTGKRMTTRDFQDEQCYFNEKRWLINRTVHGWGVVCGLDVKPTEDNKGVEVTPGLAIDCCGREILVCGDAEDRYVPLIPEEHECDLLLKEEEQQNVDQLIAICLEYDECKQEIVNLPFIACDEIEKHEFNRIRDSWKITPIRIPEEFWDKPLPFCQIKGDKEKSLHSYLCEKITEGCQQCPVCRCIILAVVTVDENGEVKEIDTCNHRKLVYSNQLLFDQISCYHGDLPRVINIEWSDTLAASKTGVQISEQIEQTAEEPVGSTWIHKQDIPWDDFIKKNGLKVTFNKIMDRGSINKHTFLIAIIIIEHSTRYRLIKYVPSQEIKFTDNDEEGTTSATFKFEESWIEDELVDKDRSAITQSREGADFEIILRGSSIFSIEGKALDGSFSGEFPSGKGTQGTDFKSWFHVES